MKLIATKTRRYGARALRAGDPFEARPAIGRVLVAIGHATLASGTYQTKVADTANGDGITDLRAEYTAKIGKKPFHGWDAETLRAKIAEALAQ